MTLTAAVVRADFSTSSSNHHSEVRSSSKLTRKQKRLAFVIPKGIGNFHFKLTVNSVFDNTKSSINDNGAAEPTLFLLESLFSKAQRPEEQMSRNSRFAKDISVGLNLDNLEFDLHAVLDVLKKKEEALHNAERMVLLEHAELDHAKEDLKRQEKEIAIIAFEQEQLEDALKVANLNLVSKTGQIEDLKLLIKDKDCCVASVQLVLDLKQCELDNIRDELGAKNDELTGNNFELVTKSRMLDEANEVIQKQDVELQELHKMVLVKQCELQVLLELRRQDEENCKIAENNLKNQTMEFLVAQEEAKKIAEETSRSFKENNKTFTEFIRVKKLLADVRSELVVSQKSLSLSKEYMESQELLLDGQLTELDEQKASLLSYFSNLKDAHDGVESQRAQLRVAVARNKELEDELSVKKGIMEEFVDELKKEKVRLEQVSRDKSVLKEELDVQSRELEEAHRSILLKDSELVYAKLEIQRLQSQQYLLNQLLNEKDAELLCASKRLEEMSKEVVELKVLVLRKEDRLVQASNMLKEKDAHLQVMQHELNDSKLKYMDAEIAVQKIVDLTNELVVSTKTESEVEVLQYSSDTLFSKSELERRKVGAEISLAGGNLRSREMDVLASQRAVAIKDEEVKLVGEKLDLNEEELNTAKEVMAHEADELKKLHARIGDKSIGHLAMEKLQLQLEAEAATSALTKLAELSRELLKTSTMLSEADVTTCTLAENVLKPAGNSGCSDCSHLICDTYRDFADFAVVKSEVARLVTLTEELMHEAGLV